MTRHRIQFLIGVFVLLWLGFHTESKAAADPLYVHVCSICDHNHDSAPILFESAPNPSDYIPKVMAQEWGGDSSLQTVYAAAITVRTFAQRPPGCGAWVYNNSSTGYPVESNVSQVYYGGNTPSSVFHLAAQSTVGKKVQYGGGPGHACLKYKANNGDPTAQGGETPTLSAIADPVDSNCCGLDQHWDGLSQNGTYAWGRYTPNQPYWESARWTWHQMLSHYYTSITFSAGTNNTFVSEPNDQYRWTWTNTGYVYILASGNIAGTNEQYSSPVTNTPGTMSVTGIYAVSMRIQNASTRTWLSDGLTNNPIRLGYHWYYLNGLEIPLSPDRDIRTPLGGNQWLAPGDWKALPAQVRTPNVVPGWYLIQWDMVEEGITWFNWQGGGRTSTQLVLVAVDQSTKHVVVYQDVFYNGAVQDYGPGSYALDGQGSSLLIPAGCTVTLRAGSSSISLSGYEPDLRDLGWNDRATSMDVQCS